MKKYLLILLSCLLMAMSWGQDASAMQIYKAAKLARQGNEPVAAQHIRHRKKSRRGHRLTKRKAHVRRSHRTHRPKKA